MKESHASLYTHHNSHVPFKRALNTFKYQSPLFELSLILLNSNIVLSVYLFVEENIVLVIIYNLLKGHCINSVKGKWYQKKRRRYVMLWRVDVGIGFWTTINLLSCTHLESFYCTYHDYLSTYFVDRWILVHIHIAHKPYLNKH